MKDNYLENIRKEIITTEAKVVVRNYKNNLDKLTRNYNIGKEISEAGKHYGEGIVKKYALSELQRMRNFYIIIKKVLHWSTN